MITLAFELELKMKKHSKKDSNSFNLNNEKNLEE